jgi:uncharacterized protein YxjI
MALPRRRHRDAATTTYVVREHLFSIGDDYWIETQAGERAIRVDGEALRVRDTLVLETPSGEELVRVQERRLRARDAMEIRRGSDPVATVRKTVVGVRDRFRVHVRGGDDLDVVGNIVDHEYDLRRDRRTVAEVSKRWADARDTYGIGIAPGQDDALMLAAAVCLDRMAND